MTIAKGLATVGGCSVGGGILGGLAGYLIGLCFPGAYRALFRPPPGESINPMEVGIGLGLAQGLMIGALVGILLVVIVTWYEVRTRQEKP